MTLFWILDTAAELYIWIIVARVVLSWLINFNVINPFSPPVQAVQRLCYAATEPLMAPIRRVMPDLGGIDISPLVLILGVQLVRTVLFRAMIGNLMG